MQKIENFTCRHTHIRGMMRPFRTIKPTKCVMASDLKVIQNMLNMRKEPSVHFVNGINVSDDVINTKVVYVFKDPLQTNDKLVHINQGVLAALYPTTLEFLKTKLDLYFQVYAISKKDFTLYLQDNNVDGIVIYNAYSDIRKKTTYMLYFDA
jgi:hypothetical protein